MGGVGGKTGGSVNQILHQEARDRTLLGGDTTIHVLGLRVSIARKDGS